MPSSACDWSSDVCSSDRSEEHTSELQSRSDLVCRLLLEKKKKNNIAAIKAHATQPKIEISQAFHPTLHVQTEQRFGMLLNSCVQAFRQGEDTIPLATPMM